MSNAEIRGRFVWHELMTTDTDAAGDFYSHVVPWKTQDSGMPSYTLWMSGKHQAAGLMALPEGDASATPPHWLIYIGTPDVDATVEAADKLGGKILKPAADIPNVGRFAVLSDPQGAAFAVFTPGPVSGEGPSPGGGVGDFTWHELATTDSDSALSFYSELFGWSKGATHDMGEMGIYQIVSHGGKDVGGIYKVRDNSTPPNWLSYASVADAAKAADAAKSAGGRILKGPIEVPGGSWIVMMLDPQGGAFAVVEAPKAKAAAKPAKDKPAKKTPAKTASAPAAKATPVAEAPAKEPAAKPAPAKSAPAKKTAATKGKKSAAKKSPAKKAPAKKAPAKKAPAKKAPARKAVAKKGVAKKKTAAKSAAAKKSTTAKRGSAPKKGAKGKAKSPARKKAKSKK